LASGNVSGTLRGFSIYLRVYTLPSRRDKERHVRNSLISNTFVVALINIAYQVISDPVICKVNTLTLAPLDNN
jgi:hypothetical protein